MNNLVGPINYVHDNEYEDGGTASEDDDDEGPGQHKWCGCERLGGDYFPNGRADWDLGPGCGCPSRATPECDVRLAAAALAATAAEPQPPAKRLRRSPRFNNQK